MLKKDIDYRKGLVIALFLIILRLVLAHSQMVFIYPFSAPLDDDLYFNWANSIAAGNWLGEYNYLTLSKYPFFGVYLAGLHILGIPYLIGNACLWIIAGALSVWALAPVLKSNISKLAMFALLIYCPYSFDATALRVYRDTIFPVLCLMFFMGMSGWALRLKKDIKQNVGFLVLAGIALGLAWITREDGYWLLPFGIAAIAICIIYIIIDKKLKNKLLRVATTTIPAAITLVCILTICSINNKYYGVFTLSDFNDGSFAQAFGAMTRLSHENWHPLVDVPQDVRERMYEGCPSFEQFREYLDDESSSIRNGYCNKEIGDYKSGHLYWGMRRAAQELGIYDTATKAEAFWAQLAVEVNALRQQDPDALPPRSSVTPPIKAEYVLPVISGLGDSAKYLLTWKNIQPWEGGLSDVTTGQIPVWEQFLKTKSNYAAIENSYVPYHTPFQARCYAFIEGFTWIYRALTIVGIPLAVIGLFMGLVKFKKYSEEKQIFWFILLGLLAMCLFRMAIIAFMDVAAFDLGPYSMYLGAVYPMMIILSFFSCKFIKD